MSDEELKKYASQLHRLGEVYIEQLCFETRGWVRGAHDFLEGGERSKGESHSLEVRVFYHVHDAKAHADIWQLDDLILSGTKTLLRNVNGPNVPHVLQELTGVIVPSNPTAGDRAPGLTVL